MTEYLAFAAAAGTYHDTDTAFGTVLLSDVGGRSVNGFEELSTEERAELETWVDAIADEIHALGPDAERTREALREALDNVDLKLTGIQRVRDIPFDEARDLSYGQILEILQARDLDPAEAFRREVELGQPQQSSVRRASLGDGLRAMFKLARTFLGQRGSDMGGRGL